MNIKSTDTEYTILYWTLPSRGLFTVNYDVMYTYTHVCVCIYIYIYIYTHARTHIHWNIVHYNLANDLFPNMIQLIQVTATRWCSVSSMRLHAKFRKGIPRQSCDTCIGYMYHIPTHTTSLRLNPLFIKEGLRPNSEHKTLNSLLSILLLSCLIQDELLTEDKD